MDREPLRERLLNIYKSTLIGNVTTATAADYKVSFDAAFNRAKVLSDLVAMFTRLGVVLLAGRYAWQMGHLEPGLEGAASRFASVSLIIFGLVLAFNISEVVVHYETKSVTQFETKWGRWAFFAFKFATVVIVCSVIWKLVAAIVTTYPLPSI